MNKKINFNNLIQKINIKTFSSLLNHNANKKYGKPRVVVLGTGWASFRFIKGINQKYFDVKVISPRNHFIFTPLLASTTVGTLEFRAVTEPTRQACKNFIEAKCTSIDADKNKIVCYDDWHKTPFEVEYDYLVLGVGASPNTFGTPGVYEHCNFLRQINDARQIRKKLLSCFEKASSPNCTPEERKVLLSFMVVGGGPTSIEFSGELHDFLVSDFRRFYPQIDIKEVKITLLEASDHILGMFDRNLSDYCESYFKKKNINILTKVSIKEVKKNEIHLKDGTIIPFGFCVWSTGNTPCDLVKSLNFEKDRGGRLVVDEHLNVIGKSNIFAFGDCSTQKDLNLPQTAQCAQQEGLYLSKLFKKIEGGYNIKSQKNFKYAHIGAMSYIGGYKALVNINKHNGKGTWAWLFWRSAYFTKLLSIRNKILVPMYWFKAFIFGRDISQF